MKCRDSPSPFQTSPICEYPPSKLSGELPSRARAGLGVGPGPSGVTPVTLVPRDPLILTNIDFLLCVSQPTVHVSGYPAVRRVRSTLFSWVCCLGAVALALPAGGWTGRIGIVHALNPHIVDLNPKHAWRRIRQPRLGCPGINCLISYREMHAPFRLRTEEQSRGTADHIGHMEN